MVSEELACVQPTSLLQLPLARCLELHTGDEKPGQTVAVVGQLSGVLHTGFLWVHDGCAPELVRPVAWL